MTNAVHRLRRHAAALLPALALGCADGGQTGEETTVACEETRAALAQGEDSPLGFGADEVLATASVERVALEWLVTDPAYGPESGSAELTLALEALGPAAFVTSRTLDGREAFPCFDRVEVDVAVTLGTSGGALDENFDGRLQATDATTATLTHVFENGDVDGTLSFDEASLAGRRVVRVTFEASFSDGAMSGALSAGIEQVFGDTASFQEPAIACFGESTARCPER
jgi:hypothetical protein